MLRDRTVLYCSARDLAATKCVNRKLLNQALIVLDVRGTIEVCGGPGRDGEGIVLTHSVYQCAGNGLQAWRSKSLVVVGVPCSAK